MAEKEKGLIKFITSNAAIISVLITLFTAIITANYQFAENRRKSSDENFRSIITMLSSENKEQRLAAASNIGTFIKKGSYWPFIIIKSGSENTDNAIDILINRISVELDYNVLNAIIGSLEKVEKIDEERYRKIIDDLLAINRNIFIQDYALKKWKTDAEALVGSTESPGKMEKELIKREGFFKRDKLEVDRVMLDGLKEKMQLVWKDYYKRDNDYLELTMHKQAVTDIISVFLSKRAKKEKSLDLVFYQNSLNTAILTDLNLSKSKIDRSALSLSMIQKIKFDGSTIIDTVFTFSDLTKSSFKDCTLTASLFDQITSFKEVSFSGSIFKDVFFAGSDLTGADFKGVKDLKPIYFYKTKNIENAIFDPEFKQKLDEILPKITVNEFIKYIENSMLNRSRKDALLLTLDELKKPEKKKTKV